MSCVKLNTMLVTIFLCLVGFSGLLDAFPTTEEPWDTEEMDTDIDIVEDCKEERECKAACGYSAQDTRCNKKEPVGVCTCLNDYGPPRRCRNVTHEEERCTTLCKRKVAQICYTDFGKFCACFVRY